MTEEQQLAGRTALVTGASRGIGAAIAYSLGKRGAHVIMSARTAGGLEDVEEAIHKAGGVATIAPLDLSDGDQIARLAAAVKGRWETLDIMILNAAILGDLGPVAQMDGKNFSRIMTLNLLSQQALIAHFDPLLRGSDDAALIGLSSSVGRNPRAFWGGYGASKAAFENLLLAYGAEVAGMSNIRTAIIDPGKTRTKMRSLAYPGEDPQSLKPADIVGEAVADLIVKGFDNGHYSRIEG